MNSTNDTDLLFAGGGLSGLSLAWHIETSMPGRYRMIIVDREQNKGNDRTWCFWEKGDGPFESQVLTSWDTLQVKGSGWENVMDIRPYRYKMIRSAALYNYVRQTLEASPGIRFVTADVLSLEDGEGSATLHTSIGSFQGKWLFNSAIRPQIPPGHSRSLIQHFKGYFLRTPQPFFDPELPLFMDFRVDQGKDVRFVYV
ncbi:MAG: lycopene cyclase, partial [Bacteroidales bacterium]|nr:lycopene cyclase [Bacteroidales bacterium]